MSKNTLDQRFRAAFADCEGQHGRGFQARIAELADISSSQINDFLADRRGFPEEKRRSLLGAVNTLLGKNNSYEDFLALGQYIIENGSADGWVPPTKGMIAGNLSSGLAGSFSATSEPIEDRVAVSYFPDTYASAGNGAINSEQSRTVMYFDRQFLVSMFGRANYHNVHIVHAVGDSMHSEIHEGDILFVNHGDTEVITGAVYVFQIGEETLVKRAERNPLTGDLALMSDNEKYAPIKVTGDDAEKLRVVGRVMGNLKKL